MNKHSLIPRLNTLKDFHTDRLAWLWLLIGFLVLPFTFFQTVIPLAAWLAPIFLLRFSRTSKRSWVVLPLIFLAYVVAIHIASRGLPFSLLGLLGNVLFKGIMWMLPFAADRLLERRLEGWARTLVFPFAFTSVDWIISLLRVSSSGSPAYSQGGILVLLQLISITGMWGITFLIMWCASIVNGLWENGFHWRLVRGPALIFSALLVSALIYGGLRLNGSLPSTPRVNIATITIDSAVYKEATGSIDANTILDNTQALRDALRPKIAPTINQMLARSEVALKDGAKIVAWQESSGWVLEEDKLDVLARTEALARQYGAYLQISLEVFTHAQSLPNFYNQSILINPEGRVLWTYNKTHPVPYDEAFYTIPGTGELPLIDTPYGRWSTAICYDTYYPSLIRQAGRGGTDILFAPTNEAASFPWALSALAIADYRAIENGFSMVRPTGNGISAVIDPDGRILAQADYFSNSAGIMVASIPTQGVTTLYSRIGDLFAYLCFAGLVSLAAWAFINRKHSMAVVQHRLTL
jgi:apolipoprotein N-acyltransferase